MRRFLYALVGVSVVNPDIDRVEAKLNDAEQRHEQAAKRFEEVSSRCGFGVVVNFETHSKGS